MDMEQRQREAGLPPLTRPLARPHDLDRAVPPPADEEGSAVGERAREATRRSRERRAARTRSAGRSRVTLAAGSLLAMVGLAGAMWLTADGGSAQADPEPVPAEDGGVIPSPGGVEVPAAPTPSPAPADRAPEGRSGAS
jgi:hypothetical protein